MKTFLLPVDFSEVTDDIVDNAVTFASALKGKVVLLHVIQPPVITSEYALPAAALQEALDAGEKAATKKLSSYADIVRKAGLHCEALVRQGSPVRVIIEEATRVKSDFIIMGSHGHGKLYDLLVGSTASGVIKRARCGVIILPSADKYDS
jgi:nucleotide-binding universal stress UspA family protein